MWRICIPVIATLCVAQCANAGWINELKVVSEKDNIVCSESSGWIALKIVNSKEDTPVTLTSWQVVLSIVSLDDKNAVTPSLSYEIPKNYVFGTTSVGVSLSPEYSSGYSFSDIFYSPEKSETGVVLSGSGEDLVLINLSLLDAVGRFKIDLVANNDDFTGSFWGSTEGFFNFVSENETIAVVEFVAKVPEPSVAWMSLSGIAFLTFVIVFREKGFQNAFWGPRNS